MKNKLLLLLILVVAITACKNDSKNNNSKEVNSAIDQTLDSKSNAWSGKLDQLLTLQMAAKAFGYEPSEAEVNYRKTFENPDTHDLTYEWDKGRQKEMDVPHVGKMKFPETDRVELRWVKVTSLENFKNSYRTPTQEELANAEKVMKERMAEQVKEGKMTQEQANMASGLGSSLGSGVSYDIVTNVGDYALWNNKDKNLSVFYKGLQFQLAVYLGDEATNKAKAVDVAQMIIKEKL